MHIAGVVLRVQPQRIEEVCKSMTGLEGVELHAVDNDGRLVVTIEGEERQEVADSIFKLDSLKYVLSSSMVYEESETDH
ncbi:MAG: chaperone NapD [Gammaproteobacteria bacterium]|nr:chaperone NapD [Gammaproteobacteria bacterium]